MRAGMHDTYGLYQLKSWNVLIYFYPRKKFYRNDRREILESALAFRSALSPSLYDEFKKFVAAFNSSVLLR